MTEQFITLLFLALFNACLIVLVFRASSFVWHPDAIAGINHIPEDSDERGITEDSKGLLWWVGFYCQTYLGQFWSKPICTCVMCMASLWSILPFWGFDYLYGINDSLIWYVPYMAVLSVLSLKIENLLQ